MCLFFVTLQMLKMENFTEVTQGSDNKNLGRFEFVRKNGFKRGMFLLILLTFLSIVYTFLNKLSSPNVNKIYEGLFARMEEEFRNSPMMKGILKIVGNGTGIENL